MITKKNYGNIENVTIAQFGYGTMRVVNATAADGSYKAILLGDQEQPRKIGEVGEFCNDSDEFNPKMALSFANKESFDVFCIYIDNLKKEFEEEIDQ